MSTEMRMFDIAVNNAVRNVGKAVFDFQPLVVQKGLVAAAILTLISGQDESVSDQRVRALVLKLDSMLSDWGA
jgi:hypothetical protein